MIRSLAGGSLLLPGIVSELLAAEAAPASDPAAAGKPSSKYASQLVVSPVSPCTVFVTVAAPPSRKGSRTWNTTTFTLIRAVVSLQPNSLRNQ